MISTIVKVTLNMVIEKLYSIDATGRVSFEKKSSLVQLFPIFLKT
jgi:hypothetical protein